MNEKKFYLPGADALSVPAATADALLSLRDGDCALLYLYILRSGGTLDEKQAARDLGRAEEAVRAAAEALGRAGLLRRGDGRALPPADELPEYSVRDILVRSEGDPSFRALVAEAQRVLGHALSGADLKTLFGVYDRLGMPGDVIMLMINHVAAQLRRRYGEGRLPTMHAVEKEAFRWANREIFTAEQAESYMAEADRREQEEDKLRRLLQISDRRPTKTERDYMDAWLAMGYGCDALALAYDRTVVRTGRLNWSYMDKIVRSWYEKGLFTPEEIEKGDARPPKRRDGAPKDRTASASRGDDAARLAELLKIGRTDGAGTP